MLLPTNTDELSGVMVNLFERLKDCIGNYAVDAAHVDLFVYLVQLGDFAQDEHRNPLRTKQKLNLLHIENTLSLSFPGLRQALRPC
jgi:hypothetical protein